MLSDQEIHRALEGALQCHRAGRLAQAQALYEQVLETAPDHPDALHLLGVLTLQVGRPEASAELIARAMERRPHFPEAQCNLGLALETMGRLDEAAERYRQALASMPDYLEAHFNLRNVLLQSGRTHDAVSHFRRAADLDPGRVEFHINLGDALVQAGQSADAVACFRTALSIDPKSFEAMVNLGTALREIGDLEGAIREFRGALEQRADVPEVHATLGNALISIGDIKGGLASLDAALRVDPTIADVYAYRSKTLATIGDAVGAVDSLKRALDIDPDATASIVYEYLRRAKPDATDPHLLRARARLAMEHLTDEDRMLLDFGVAKAEADLGLYGQAMQRLIEGNAIRKQRSGYGIEQDIELFQSIRDFFSPPSPSPPSADGTPHRPCPLFILGMPRSGTSLVEQILACHSKVHGGGELEFLPDAVRRSGWDVKPDRAAVMATVKSDYLGHLAGLSQRPYVTDKTPLNFRWIGFILEALPGARIVHLRRSPPAVCWSNFRTFFPAGGMNFTFDLHDVAAYYGLYEDLMAFWRERHPGALHELNYETLTAEPEREIRRLLDALDLEWEPAVLEFHNSDRPVFTASDTQVRSKIYTGSSEEWQSYREWLGPMLDGLAPRR